MNYGDRCTRRLLSSRLFVSVGFSIQFGTMKGRRILVLLPMEGLLVRYWLILNIVCSIYKLEE